MLPKFLDSTYKKYKADTSIFIKWLHETGQKCGCKVAETKREPVKAGPRLKGKARKEAKARSVPTPTNGQNASPPNLVSLGDLMPLAEAIIGSKDVSIKVPIEILRAGLRAVSARKRCASHFAQYESSSVDALESNITHSYFITLMEKVITVLQPRFAVQVGRKNGETVIEELQNRFSTLDVEETSEEFAESSESAGASKAKSQAERPTYELRSPDNEEDKREDKLFAIYCLLNDLNRLRQYLINVWTLYKMHQLDLITASVTTNTAIQLAIRIQDDFMSLFPGSADYTEVFAILLAQHTIHQFTVGEYHIGMSEEKAQWIFAPAREKLASFCKVLTPGETPVMERGYFGVYNPRADRSRMNKAARDREDDIILLELLPEFCILENGDVPLFAKDELTKGLCRMVRTKEVPVWLVFGVTVFLDIHSVLRESVTSAFQELQTTAGNFAKPLDEYFELSEGLAKPATWPQATEQRLGVLKKQIELMVLQDHLFPYKVALNKDLQRPSPSPSERFYLYHRHPLLCGMIAFAVLLEQRQYGLTLVLGMGTVMYPAHFYNALRVKPSPCAPWPLMDDVIAMHGEDSVFLGAKPTNVAATFTQICICLGHSAVDFSINRRRGIKIKPSKRGPRGLNEISPLAKLFYSGLRLNPVDGAMTFIIYKVEALLNDQALNKDLAGTTKSKRLRHEWAATKSLSTIDLLDTLVTSIPYELPKLKFDYFELHRQSIGLLRSIHRDMDEDLKKAVGPGYFENESHLPMLGLYTLLAAVETLKQAEAMKKSNVGSRLLEKAGDILNQFVAGLGT